MAIIRRSLMVFIIATMLILNHSDFAIPHPHVFIVTRIKVVFDEKGLSGFMMRWAFDDMFSSMITGDYDKNKNGQLEKSEVDVVKKEAFSNVAAFDYFTFIKIDQKPFKVKFITDFTAYVKNSKLIYEFFIPCHVTALEHPKDVKVAVYDKSYYTAIYFAEKNPLSLENAGAFEVKAAIREDESTAIYYDMVHPWTLFLEFRVKP